MTIDRKPNRMKGYDYSADNFYFVTTCVHDRVCCFGIIDDGIVGTGRDLSLQLHHHNQNNNHQIMILNEYGQIAEKQWFWLAGQYHYIILHAFVVMPNHIHGIIKINRQAIFDDDNPELKIKSLSEIMGAYKTTVSKQIHLLGYSNFAWQRSFHDHIIRDDRSFQTISNYILKNPLKWGEDKFYNQ